MKKYFIIIVFVLGIFYCTISLCQPPSEVVPAFDSPVVEGIQFIIRLSDYDYAFDAPVHIERWIKNRSATDQIVCIFPHEFTFYARLEKDGKLIFDTEDGFVSAGDFAEGIGDKKPAKEDYFELKPGWSLHIEDYKGFIPLDAIIGKSLELANLKILPGEYNLTLRFSQKVFNGEEFGLKSWTGTVDSNTVKLRILPLPDVDTLMKQLDSPSPKIRAKAVGMLGKVKEPLPIEPFIALLKDNDAQVRLNTAAVLGIFADSRAVEPLIPLLDDNDALVVRYAAMSLAKIGDKRAIEPLVKKLSSESPMTKCDILEALKILPVPDSAVAIAALLKDKKRSVRYAALHSLPSLLVTDPAQRNEILKSLITATTDEYFEIRGDSASALVEFSDSQEVVDVIVKLLKDEYPYVRLKAVLAVGEIKPAGAVDILTPLVDDDDKDVRDEVSKVISLLENVPDDDSDLEE